MAKFNKNSNVRWKWGTGTGEGKVQSVLEQKTTRNIKGTEIVKHGSKKNPAYYIKQANGTAVLKLESELLS